MPHTWSRYYDDGAEAAAQATAAKGDGLNVALLGPVQIIRRPKIGAETLERWPSPPDKDWWVVVATSGDLTLV